MEAKLHTPADPVEYARALIRQHPPTGDLDATIAERERSADRASMSQVDSASPEVGWLTRLVDLHLQTRRAIRSHDGDAVESCRREAIAIQEEIQPDHATSQPWGLNAMLLSRETWPTAEMMIHAAESAGLEPIALLLIADAVYCSDCYQTL